MPYVIKCVGPRGGYVAPQGSEKPYTSRLSKARKFSFLEEAEIERCLGREVIEPWFPSEYSSDGYGVSGNG